MEQKLGCLEAYRQHLHDTFCDRTMIWSMQAESADFNSSILVIATDGLDQSKFALPREPEMRINSGLTFRSNGMIFQMFCNTLKILLVNLVLDLPAPASLRAKHQRPRMKVHGTWAMGYQLNVFPDGWNCATWFVRDNRDVGIDHWKGGEFLDNYALGKFPTLCFNFSDTLMSILQIFDQFWPWKVITICDEEGRPRPQLRWWLWCLGDFINCVYFSAPSKVRE